MYERKIMSDLLAWKGSASGKRMALVVKGLRQVGKTFVVERFARESYESDVADAFSKMGRETWIVEVKTTTGNAKSPFTVMRHPDLYGPCRVCKLGDYDIGEANGVLTLPYYLAFMLR